MTVTYHTAGYRRRPRRPFHAAIVTRHVVASTLVGTPFLHTLCGRRPTEAPHPEPVPEHPTARAVSCQRCWDALAAARARARAIMPALS